MNDASTYKTRQDKVAGEVAARLFIVGCPRSGTTLLQSLLCAHPQVFSVPESHLYSRLSSRNRLLRRLGIARFDAPEVFAKVMGSLGLPAEKPRGLTTSFYLQQFLRLFDEATLRAGKSVWLEKTPRHLYHIPEIQRTLPGAKFIHIVRDGADVVASLYEVTQEHPKVWGGARSIDACIARWIRDVELSRRYEHRPDHILVRYEALTADPEACLRRLFAFIGLPFVPEVLRDYRRVSQRVTAPGEAWKASVQGNIRDTHNHKFNHFLPSRQAYILERLRPYRKR